MNNYRKYVLVGAVPLLLVLGFLGVGNSSGPGIGPAGKVRRIQLTAADVARLPKDKKLVIDLSSRGVIYEFDSTVRRIDFSRISVHTTAGDRSIESWLKDQLPAKELTGWDSGRLRIAAAAGDLRNPRVSGAGVNRPSSSGSGLPYSCSDLFCRCKGDDDCNNMFSSGVCGDGAFCTSSGHGVVICFCRR